MNLIYNYIFPGGYAPGYICKSKIHISYWINQSALPNKFFFSIWDILMNIKLKIEQIKLILKKIKHETLHPWKK